MKNKQWIWGGVIALVAILVIFLFDSKIEPIENMGDNKDIVLGGSLSEKNAVNDLKPTTPTAVVKNVAVSGMKTSLGGIFSEKGNYQCDYEQVTNELRSSNVVYVSDGKMRGEFRTSQTGGGTSTIVVYDGSYLYTWTEGQSKGTVSQPKTLADLPSIIPEDVSSGRILGSGTNSVSWNCHAWSKDASKLVKPSYVNFY